MDSSSSDDDSSLEKHPMPLERKGRWKRKRPRKRKEQMNSAVKKRKSKVEKSAIVVNNKSNQYPKKNHEPEVVTVASSAGSSSLSASPESNTSSSLLATPDGQLITTATTLPETSPFDPLLHLRMRCEWKGKRGKPYFDQNFFNVDDILLGKSSDIGSLEVLKAKVLQIIRTRMVLNNQLDLANTVILTDYDNLNAATPFFIRCRPPYSLDYNKKDDQLKALIAGNNILEEMLKSAFQIDSKHVLDLWVLLVNDEQNERKVSSAKKPSNKVAPETINHENVSFLVNLYPVVHKDTKTSTYQLNSIRENVKILRTFTLKPVYEERISMDLLRTVLGHSYKVVKNDHDKDSCDVGKLSQLYYLPVANQKRAMQISSDEDLWKYVETILSKTKKKDTNDDSACVELHRSMGKRKKIDDVEWNNVPVGFDPSCKEDLQCIADVLSEQSEESIRMISFLSPEVLKTNADRRESQRLLLIANANIPDKVEKWLSDMLSSNDSVLYNSMNMNQRKLAKAYLTTAKNDTFPSIRKPKTHVQS